MKRLSLITVLFFLPLATFANSPVLTEWPVPWDNSRPRDPDVGPAGMVWFVGQRGNYVARLDPQSGDFKRLPLDPGTGPHNLIVADDGTIWYAGNTAAHIGKMDPETGAIHKIAMPDPRARDPHTLTFDDNGDIWFTVQGGNFVGKLSVADEKVALIDVPTRNARPYGIKVDDVVWVVLLGTNKLARVDAGTQQLQEIELPRAEARPRRLEVTSDGAVWYVDYAGGKLGRYNPENESFAEWDMPSGANSRPYGMAVDAKDRLWIVETGVSPSRFVGFDTSKQEFLPGVAISSGGGVRHMVYDEERNAVWFGTDSNTIGRAQLP